MDDLEARCIVVALNDLQFPRRHLLELLGQLWPRVTAVGPNEFQEREQSAHLLENCHGAVSILDRGLMNDRLQQEPPRIDDDIWACWVICSQSFLRPKASWFCRV